MNDRLIQQILADEYFTKKPKNKKDIRPLPPIFNPRPKFFVFGKISKQTNFLQLKEKDGIEGKKKQDIDEEEYFGLVKPERIISNDLNTVQVYKTQKTFEKKPTFMRKPTKKASNDGLIDLEDNYIGDLKYFDEKK
jgi:hypothetical protein